VRVENPQRSRHPPLGRNSNVKLEESQNKIEHVNLRAVRASGSTSRRSGGPRLLRGVVGVSGGYDGGDIDPAERMLAHQFGQLVSCARRFIRVRRIQEAI